MPSCTDCQKVHRVHVAATTVDPESNAFDELLAYYSSWHRLKRAVAIYKRLLRILKSKQVSVSTEPITVKEMESAGTIIVSYIQKKYFSTEINGLSNHSKRVHKQSSIYKLDPFIATDDGLLRVGGRVQRLDAPRDTKHPVLLPKKSHVTTLIIRNSHESLAHAGRNHVLSKLREKFWITNANSAVRNLLFHCVKCRKFREPVAVQKMSSLPQDCIDTSSPFGNVGVDYFGPFIVKEGRK